MTRTIVYQLDANGLPAKRTADFAIGHPSLYGRKASPAIATRQYGSRMSGFAYDSVHARLFIRDGSVNAWGPAGRILLFDVHPDRMKNGPEALAVFGQPDFTSRTLGGVGPKQMASIDGTVLDERNQRLFATDGPNNRILVWDIDPARLTEAPEPIVVIGQTDLTSKISGAESDRLNRPGSIYYDDANDRLFAVDSGNNRILVFDARPRQLKTGAKATAVIGQADFSGRQPGIGPDHLNRPGSILLDPANQRLFLADGANRRILVFDVAPNRLKSGATALHVLGQNDFFSRESRMGMKKAVVGSMEFDSIRQRLYISDSDPVAGIASRMLVFDVHPNRIQNNPDAIAVLFQEGFDKFETKVSRSQESAPGPFLDETLGKLYVSGHHDGGNRVSIFDVSGPLKEAGMPSIDVLGHYDGDGNVDFEARQPNGRSNGRFIYPRAVALDRVDHRLFVNDQYLNRILVFQLDKENRILNRTATVILGQPHAYTGKLQDASAQSMRNPLAVAYHEASKRLFVGDTWNQRILVFDAHPDRLETYAKAIMVIGQPDFESVRPVTSATGITFSVPSNIGMTSTQPTPLAMEIDQQGHRLFVSDGGNHRVLVYDISEGKLKTWMAATNVIGQPNFEGNQRTPRNAVLRGAARDSEGGDAGSGRVTDNKGFDTPSGLSFDPNHNRLIVVDGNNSRVLIFDATPGKLQNGPQATAVLGQMDFTSGDEVRLDRDLVSEDVARSRMRMPNGVAYDTVNDRLYVGDKGNDRILIFEAAPDKLKSGMAATGVIGQKDFITRTAGDGEQEELLDPRELEFDSEHQRLYVTDSFWARLPIYDIPQSERRVKLGPQSMTNYSTLDAWNGRDKPELDQKKDWQAKLTAESGQVPGSILVYTKTRQFRNPMSQRRSRILISETAVAAPEPVQQALFYLDQGPGKNHLVVVSNSNSKATQVEFRFYEGSQTWKEKKTVAPGAQLEVLASELFGPWIAGKMGTLRIESELPLTSLLLRQTKTTRGEEMLLAIPRAKVMESSENVIAGIRAGGGYESELVLVNPYEEAVTGQIDVLQARNGQPVTWPGPEPCESISYQIPPGGVLRWQLRSTSFLPEQAYAVIRAGSAMKLPWASAVVGIWKASLLLSQTVTPAKAQTQMAWAPVDTLPSTIRHGEVPSKMYFTVANSSRTPALLRFTLFDSAGSEKGRYEQLVEPATQREWSLADMFNVQTFKGSVRVWSDVPVALSNKRVTATVRGEPVESEIGYVEPGALQDKTVIELPEVTDGNGISTEIVLINPTNVEVKAVLKTNSPDGRPSEIVLR